VDEPHALLKLRRVYNLLKGPQLNEQVLLNEHSIRELETKATKTPQTDAVRIRPGPAELEIRSSFFRTETRWVQETYTEYRRDPCGYTRSASGITQTRYCSKSIPRRRLVPRVVQVPLGSCQAKVTLQAVQSMMYLLQYSFNDAGHCSLSCFQQTPTANGGFANQRCPPAVRVD
jgi:hypothetical protein